MQCRRRSHPVAPMCRLNANPAPGLRIAPAAKNAVRERDTLRAMSFPLSNPQNTPPANLCPPSRENLTPELDFDRIASVYTNGLGRSSPSAIGQRARPGLICGDRHGAPPTDFPRVVAALAFVNCEKLATVAPSKITALRDVEA